MSETVLSAEVESRRRGRAQAIALWVARIAVAGILGMAAFSKFFLYTPEGSMALADALGVGRGAILTIGLVEATAVALILLSRTWGIGALLAAATMAGALFAHATRIGWSGSSVAEMWPLALVALAAASSVAALRYLRR